MEYFNLVKSLEYFNLVESMEYFHSVESMEYFDLVESFEYFYPVDSIEYFPPKNISSFKLRIFNIVFECLYLTHSRATARRVRDAFPWEHGLARAQNVLYAHHIGSDGRVNWSDDDWDDLWDEPADQ